MSAIGDKLKAFESGALSFDDLKTWVASQEFPAPTTHYFRPTNLADYWAHGEALVGEPVQEGTWEELQRAYYLGAFTDEQWIDLSNTWQRAHPASVTPGKSHG